MADTDITMGETTLPTNGSLEEEVAVLPPLTEERPPEPTGEPQINGTPEVPVLISDPPTEGAPGTNPNASTVILRKGKEVLCRPDEAAGLNKKAQKGYAWVAVGQEQQKEPEAPVLGKRQRKKPNLADFTTPSGKKEKEKGTAGKKLKTSEEETPAGDPMNTQPVSEEKDPKEMDEVARRKMERKKALEDKLNMLADVEKQLAQIIVAKEIAPKTQPVKPRGKPGPKPKVPRTPKAAAKIQNPAVVPVVPTESTPAPVLPTPLLAEVLPAASDATEPVPLPGKGRGRARRAAAVAAVAAVNAVVEADVAAAAPLPPRGRGRGQKKRKKATEKDTETPKRRKTTKASTPQTALPPPPPPLVETLVPVATPPATPSGPASRIQRPRRQSQRYSKDDALGPVKLSYALKQCQNVLKQLMAHKYAWPFNSPVDWKLLNLPDYPEIIKHPMDLGTIKMQMETGCYENEEEFGDDVRLVWANALRYNQPGSDICIMAQELSDVFEGKFSKAMAAIGERKKTESSGVAETINELRDSMRSVQKELEMMRKLKASNGANKAPAKKEDSRPMTFEEKKKLSLAINNLPSESLGMVVKIIHERMPNLTGQGDEIEIDIDALDASTLRALERYIKTVSRKRTRNRPESPAKIEQATVTEAGTQSKIEDVERRLKELNEKAQAITQKTGIVVSPFETLPPEGADAAIAPAQTTAPTSTQPEPAKPEPPAETQDSSDSESDSGSDSSDSDSDSDSDDSDSSDTDSEADHAAAQKAVESGAGMQSTPAVKQETVPTGNATSNPVALESEKAADGVGDESHQGIAPSSPSGEPKVVDIQNISAWAELGDSPQGHEKEASKSSDKTWSAFQNRKMLEQQREVERQEKEERLRREREQREEERRKAEEQRKREIEAREAQRLKETQEAELEAQRERERLRLQAKLERERATQSINMTEQSMLMADFEQEAGVSSTPAILPMFQYKDVKDDDFDQMEEGELV